MRGRFKNTTTKNVNGIKVSNFKRDFNPENEKIENKNHLQKLVSEWVFYYNHLTFQKSLNYKTPSEY